jgi:hypothetical protein
MFPITTATKVSRQAQLPACEAPLGLFWAVLAASRMDRRRGEYGDYEDAAQDPGHHDEKAAAEEDEELELLAPWEACFEEHL